MTTIMTLLAVVAAAPSYFAPNSEAAIAFTPLSVEALSGSYRTGAGWPAPGEGRVGELCYDRRLMLRSDDSRFADHSPGLVHSRRSDYWFQWDNGGTTSMPNARIGTSGYRKGYILPQPSTNVPGFRFVAANDVHCGGFTWIGVWNTEGSAERSRIVAFRGGLT